MDGYRAIVPIAFCLLLGACAEESSDTAPVVTDEGSQTTVEDGVGPLTLDASFRSNLRLTDRVEDPAMADYFAPDGLNIEDAALTIEAGVRIAFGSDTRLLIDDKAALIVNGTALAPVHLTSDIEAKGAWRGITMRSHDPRNALNHTIIEYTGSSDNDTVYFKAPAAIGLIGRSIFFGGLALNNITIREGKGLAVGVDSDSELFAFDGVTIVGMDREVQLYPDNVHVIDGETSLITHDGAVATVEVQGDVLDEPAATLWNNPGLNVRYRLDGDLELRSALEIAAGTRIDMGPNTQIELHTAGGALTLAGSTDEPILLQGDVTSGTSWKGIAVFTSDTRNRFTHAEIRHTGSAPLDTVYSDETRAAVGLYQNTQFTSSLPLDNVSFAGGDGCAVLVQGSAVLEETGTVYGTYPLGERCL